MASSLTFRLIAPDARRPDIPQIAAALGQLQGCTVHLDVCLTSRAQEIRFSLDAPDQPRVCAVMQQLYPGSRLERVAEPVDRQPLADATAQLGLARPLPYPLKTWMTVAGQDPVAALGGAVRQLQPGERLQSRITLWPRLVTWQPPSAAMPHLTPFARMLNASSVIGLSLLGAFGYLFGLCVLYSDNLLLRAVGLAGLLAIGLGIWLCYQNYRWLYELSGDTRGQMKGYDTLFAVTLTLTAEAATAERARQLLTQWQSYYRVFDAGGSGNRWVALTESGLRRWLEGLRPIYLTATEIAGHWHVPVDVLQSPFSARQGYHPLMPSPELLEERGFPMGQYVEGQRTWPVHLPADGARAHTLVLGKTQSGKSRLVELLCAQIVEAGRSLVVIDPHSTLVQRLAGTLPSTHPLVLWDLGRTERPLPLNLLALPGADTDPNAAADQIVDVLRSLWADSWGPRTEYHLGYLLRTLLAARLKDFPTEPGRHPFTLLDIQNLIVDASFRSAVLSTVTDADLQRYWQLEFLPLSKEPRLFMDVFLPIENKIGAYLQREPVRAVVGQPEFSPFLSAALAQTGVVLVDLAQGAIGSDSARLLASTLLLAIRNIVGQRQRKPSETCVPVTVVVDECQWLTAGSLDEWMAEYTKFSVSLVGITQSLALLDAADRRLRPQLLANVGNLYSFALMAADAVDVVPELDSQVSVTDLVNLPPRHCYAKLTAYGRRQPVFSFETRPTDSLMQRLAQALADAAARRYGTLLAEIRQVWAVRQAALGRLKKGRVSTRAGDAG